MDKTEMAFPAPYYPSPFEGNPGMTLRDYFAAAVLQGVFASDTEEWFCREENYPARAKSAYQMADAMLAERSKP